MLINWCGFEPEESCFRCTDQGVQRYALVHPVE